tara:strand:- start:972 stop:1196 length:225 start_codon:yes stop_codon:yes gene_type:complete
MILPSNAYEIDIGYTRRRVEYAAESRPIRLLHYVVEDQIVIPRTLMNLLLIARVCEAPLNCLILLDSVLELTDG